MLSQLVTFTPIQAGHAFTGMNSDDQAQFLSGLVSGLMSKPLSLYEWQLQSSYIASSEYFIGGNGPQIKRAAAEMLRAMVDALEAK